MGTDLPEVNGTLPVSMKDRIAFTPRRYRGADGAFSAEAPIYYLKPLSKRERSVMFRELIRETGMLIQPEEVRAVLRDAAIAVLSPEEAARFCEVLDELEVMRTTKGDPDDEERAAHLERLANEVKMKQGRLSREYAPLRNILADQIAENEAWNSLTMRGCIRDWEHLEAPCFKRHGFVTPEAMLAIPEEDLDELEKECQALRELTTDQEPDSASP